MSDRDPRRGSYPSDASPALGGHAGTLHLIEMLEHPDPAAREQAAFALAEKGDTRAADVLLRMMQDADTHTALRNRAAYALARLGDPRVFDILVEVLKSEEGFQRISAIRALRLLGDPRATEHLLAVALTDSIHVRQEAAHALTRTSTEAEVVPVLIEAFNTAPTDMRSMARGLRASIACVLAVTHFPSAIAFLIEKLNHRSPAIRREVAYAFRTAPDERAVEALLAALQDDYGLVRARAAEALGRLEAVQAVEPLIAALGDSSQFVQSAAVAALGSIGDVRAAAPLLELMAETHDTDRLIRLVEALGEIGTPAIVEPVAALLADLARRHPQVVTQISGERAHIDDFIGEPMLIRQCVWALSAVDEDRLQAILEGLG
ncbi:MAG: HEAT repeat domain-containing protein [Anaerolineae bacterium]